MNATMALRNLQEIPLPDPVSYFPQTGGWLVLLLVLLAALATFAWRRWQCWRANRYRRDARAELEVLRRRFDDPAQRADVLRALPALIKRTALAFAPRAQVASLSGAAWLRFLDSTNPVNGNERRDQFEHGAGTLLWQCAYREPAALRAIAPTEVDALWALLARWIERHVPV